MTLLLVCTGQPDMERFAHPNLGRLVQPRHYSSVETTAHSGVPWAADNDAFNNFHPQRFERMLDRCAGLPGCKFVAAPDVVGDARATLARLPLWLPRIRQRELPVALVGQDGLEDLNVPWDEVDAFFIGGTTEWKLGAAARALAGEAKRRGKWLHMGRVNSDRRIQYAKAIGCDSVDGTKYAKFKQTWLDTGLISAASHTQLLLGEA